MRVLRFPSEILVRWNDATHSSYLSAVVARYGCMVLWGVRPAKSSSILTHGLGFLSLWIATKQDCDNFKHILMWGFWQFVFPAVQGLEVDFTLPTTASFEKYVSHVVLRPWSSCKILWLWYLLSVSIGLLCTEWVTFYGHPTADPSLTLCGILFCTRLLLFVGFLHQLLH